MCRGRLAQWKTVRFVKYRLVRPWFESCHTPSLFHVRIPTICMTPSLRNMLAELASQTRNQQFGTAVDTQPLSEREYVT